MNGAKEQASVVEQHTSWTIAAVQMKVTDHTDKNLASILDYIKQVSGKADVVCFPELSLASDEKNVAKVTTEIKTISNAAQKNSINVIFGTYRLDKENAIRNQIIVVNRKGVIVHQYNKKHSYITEREYLKEGRNNRVIVLDKIPVAVINCWDYAFPEPLRELARKGAHVIFCPSYLMSHPWTKEVLEKIPQVRAFDTMAYFVMVDAFAEETFKRTKICHPLKELARIDDKEGIIYSTIDVDELAPLREKYKNIKYKK